MCLARGTIVSSICLAMPGMLVHMLGISSSRGIFRQACLSKFFPIESVGYRVAFKTFEYSALAFFVATSARYVLS